MFPVGEKSTLCSLDPGLGSCGSILGFSEPQFFSIAKGGLQSGWDARGSKEWLGPVSDKWQFHLRHYLAVAGPLGVA